MTTRDHLTEIINLLDSGKTLAEVAKMYGVSRQRISQLAGSNRDNQLKRNNDTKLLVESCVSLTNKEVSGITGLSYGCVSNYRNGKSHKITDGNVGEGYCGEILVKNILVDFGFVVEHMGHKKPFDLLVDNQIRVDVKYAASSFCPPSWSSRSPTYRFNVGTRHKRSDCDFYVLVIKVTSDCFIVPSNVIPINQRDVIFSWPTMRPEIGKYQKYHNRWDLLRKDKTKCPTTSTETPTGTTTDTGCFSQHGLK